MNAMSRIITVYEAILNRKEKICHKSEIVEILKEFNKSIGKINPTNAIKYLSRHKYIKRILLNFYYINSVDERKRNFCIYEDKELLYIILNKLKIKWYVGLNSALYLLGKIWQTPNTIVIINNKISGRKKIMGLKARFIKTKESLIFGFKEAKTKHNIPYTYSDLPKTYLDLAYFRESDNLLSGKETKKYIKKYPKWLSKLI